MRRAAALWIALALVACRSHVPGHLGAVSVRALDLPMRVVAAEVVGRACGSDTQQNIPAAIDAALANAPGANGLVNTSFFKEPRCIRVRGTAVRVLPRDPE